jgi:hypothetical protein
MKIIIFVVDNRERNPELGFLYRRIAASLNSSANHSKNTFQSIASDSFYLENSGNATP